MDSPLSYRHRTDDSLQKPRTLIFGGSGMLAQALAEAAARRDFPCRTVSRAEADITVAEAVRRVIDDYRPQLLINAAALTDVDGCESRIDEAMAINGHAVGDLASVAEKHGVRFVHVSSDFVFDGRATRPYLEEAAADPLSVYGRSKRLGEERALAHSESLVVRSSWLFGPGGRNFAATIAKLARQRDELRVVNDQVGRPTYTPFLATAILDLATVGARGLVHYGNRPAASWYDFAEAVVRASGSKKRVVPVTTAQFPRPARRPAYSVLDVTRFENLAGRQVESWLAGLESYAPALASAALAS